MGRACFVERMRSLLPKAGRQFLGLSSFEMLAMFRRGLFYAYLTIYLRHYLGLSVTATTLFATLPMVVNILSQSFIWGRVSDRFQLRRSLIMTGEILAALGTLAVWYLHRLSMDPKLSGYILIAGLTCVELFWSMSNISWSALISDLHTEKERGRIQGRLVGMGGVGRIMGVWIGGLLYNGLNMRYEGWGFYQGTLFFVAAGVMVVSTLAPVSTSGRRYPAIRRCIIACQRKHTAKQNKQPIDLSGLPARNDANQFRPKLHRDHLSPILVGSVMPRRQ